MKNLSSHCNNKLFILQLFQIIGVLFFLSCSQDDKIQEKKTDKFTVPSKINPNETLLFKQFSSNEGLPSSQIWNTYKDRFGYLWAATNEGIVRFDGYEFHSYFSDNQSKVHLNGASFFFEDSDGELWVLSGAGFLNKFDRNADKFFHIKTPFENGWSEQSPHTILEDSLKNFWFGAYGGLQYFDRQKDTILKYPISKIRDPSWQQEEKLRFGKIVKDKRGNFWIGTRKFGLVKFDIHSKKYYLYRYDEKYYFKLLSDWITDIIPLGDGTMLISEWDVGIIHWDPINEKILSITKIEDLLQTTEHINIRDMFLEDKHHLWLGTDNQGLLLLDISIPTPKIIRQYKAGLNKKGGISGNTVRHISKDTNGNYWVSSNTLEIASPKFFQFDDYIYEKSEPNSLRQNTVYGLGKSYNQKVLVSTNLGLSVFDPSTNTFDNSFNFNVENPQTYGVLTARDSTVWLSYKDKIVHFEPKTKKVIHEYAATLTTDNNVNFLKRGCKIIEDSNGLIWTINHWGRVNFIDPKTHKIGTISEISQDLELNKFVNALAFIEDSTHKQLIVCMDIGLATIDIITKIAKKHKLIVDGYNLSKALISYIYQDKSGQYWIIIEGVIYQLDSQNFTLKKLPIKQPNNVKWIVEEPKGTYWISSFEGILKYDARTKKTQLFFTPNLGGITLDNPSPVLQMGEKIYFGGYNGLSVFEPLKFNESTNIPKVNIESAKFLMKKNRGIEGDTTVLLFNKNDLKLDYFQNKVTIKYIGLNHFYPSSVNYAYQLEGYDKDWIYTGKNREAIYTNLSPKTYYFKVKAATENGIWSDEAILKIEINPPFWKTWVAYIFYLLMISGFIYAYIRIRVHARLQKVKELEAIRTRISSNLHDDVGSVLSGLAMQSQMLAFSATGEQKESLLEISNMSHDAMERMRDTVWAIDSRKDKYENLIDRMRAFAEKTLNLLHVNHVFKVEIEDSKKFINPEKRQNIYLIFKEAITNISKHSNAKNVVILFRVELNSIYLLIHDDGSNATIKPTDGLGLNNMKMRAKAINGHIEITFDNGFKIELTIPR